MPEEAFRLAGPCQPKGFFRHVRLPSRGAAWHKSVPLRATMMAQRVAAMFDELRDQVVAMALLLMFPPWSGI